MKKRKHSTRSSRVREASAAYVVSTGASRLLLDTQVWLWWNGDDRRLGTDTRGIIIRASEVRFSAVSAWEIAVKSAIGKLEVKRLEELPDELERDGFRPLPIEIEHALAVASLPRIHGDPFDRLLVAQAKVEGLTLVTADSKLAAYGVPVLSARR